MTSDRIARGLEILVDGFFDNPVFAWVFADEATRAEALEAWFRFWIDFYGEHGTLVLDEDGAGAALWADPRTPHLDGDAAAPLVALVKRYNGDRTGVVFGALADVVPPRDPHWYLNALAARRGERSRGVGARLLAPGLERSREEGVPIYLESSNPKNLSFYYRHGFEDLGAAIDLPGVGPVMQRMWRNA